MTDKDQRLAALGGEKACPVEWPSWPVWGEMEEKAVKATLNSGGWGICPEPNAVSLFAGRFASMHDAKHGLCCMNGTVALMIALRGAQVLPGDEVIMPSYTFMATATAAIGIGATPVIVDVDPKTLNIDPSKIESAVTEKTKAILPVHLAGMPAAMDEINAVARKHDIKVVEDCAQAHLAIYGGKKVGAIGDVGAFSFQSSKNLCAGEGGLVVTDSRDIYRVAHAFHHCGRDPDGGGWYEHPYMGQNLRLPQLQAALLNSQLDRLDSQHKIRVENGRYLAERLSHIKGVQVIGWPWPERVDSASYHIFIFTIDPKEFGGVDNQVVSEALRAEGLFCHGGYGSSLQDFDFYEDPFVTRMLGKTAPRYKDVDTPVSREAVRRCIWIKQNQLLSDHKVMDMIFDTVTKVKDNADDLGEVKRKMKS